MQKTYIINQPHHHIYFKERGREKRSKKNMKKGGGSSISSGRSESDKEKSKLRERQRRAITTRIFHGLRKYGGYQISPRSDINQVLRELANEAGWVVEADGTTYRYKVVSRCPTCGVIPNTSTNTIPTASSTVIACGGGGDRGGGGDCSTTTSPRCNIDPTMTMINPFNNSSSAGLRSLYGHEHGSTGSSTGDVDNNNNPLAFYMYNGLAGGLHRPSTATTAVVGGGMKLQIPSQQQLQGTYIQEARASNKNTPVGSHLHSHRTN